MVNFFIMRLVTLLVILAFCIDEPCKGQDDTVFYSKIFDVDVGVGKGSYPIDFIFYDEYIYVFAISICDDTTHCLSIFEVDRTGEITNLSVVPKFYIGNDLPVELDGSSVIISGHQLDTTRPIEFINYNMETRIWNRIASENNIGKVINGGIRTINGVPSTYQSVFNYTTERYETSLAHWDIGLEEIVEYFDYGPYSNSDAIFDLQESTTDSIVLISRFPPSAGLYEYRISAIESDGSLSTVYSFKDAIFTEPTLLSTQGGNYYFGSFDHPEIPFPPSTGRINKVDGYTHELEWSLALPSDPYDFRSYYIYDLYEMANGDLVMCGAIEVFDEIGFAYTGFIASTSESGILRWLRIYKIPFLNIENEQLEYRRALLRRVKEDGNGNIYALGYCYKDDDEGVSILRSWMISVDNDGCLEPNNCAETNIITSLENTGGNNNEDSAPAIYPNPVRGMIYFKETSTFRYEISDCNGRILLAGRASESIEVGFLRAGVYFVKFSDSRGDRIWVKRFVKL